MTTRTRRSGPPQGSAARELVDSGFALDLSVAFRRWFLSVAPEIDFRTLIYDSNGHRTGFSRIIPIRVAVGHEF